MFINIIAGAALCQPKKLDRLRGNVYYLENNIMIVNIYTYILTSMHINTY